MVISGLSKKTSGPAYDSKDSPKAAIEMAKQFSSEVPPEAMEAVDEVMPCLRKLADGGGYAGAFAVHDGAWWGCYSGNSRGNRNALSSQGPKSRG